MAEQFDLVTIGHAIMDIVRRCDDEFLYRFGLPKGGMTIAQSPQEIEDITSQLGSGFEVSGGSAANVAVGLASLGGRAAFIGRVADDPFGRMFRHDIRGSGVIFDMPAATVSLKGTSHALILVTPDGQRTMLTHLGCSGILDTDLIDTRIIKNCQIVYIEGYLFDCPNAKTVFDHVIKLARASGKRIAICLPNPLCIDRHRSDLLELVRENADLLFANEFEVMSLYQAETFEDALHNAERDVALTVVTQSERGAIVIFNGQRIAEPAETVSKVVDATGAGDMYAAGFIYAWLQGAGLNKAARLGSFAAAEIITVAGARPAVRLEHLAKLRGHVDKIVA